MRIGVLSDSHGNLNLARQAFDQMGKIDLLLHAGDYYADAWKLAKDGGIPVKAVTGNCDFHSPGPQEEIVQAGKKRILLTHGHAYRVKYSYLSLFYRAKELEVDVVVFGHTHIAEYQVMEGVVLFNPGSIALPRRGKATFGIITCEQEQVQAHIMTLVR
ncbi:MAG: metallophosphoesterase [Firmicutes bacterium]|nr:metallophosphoesterase [Bacillota bacterium]